jgi:hypothetical protein
MPYRFCPVCREPGRMLPESSADSLVGYYRCDTCGRVWTHRKDDPQQGRSALACDEDFSPH